jgi:hypothetical protein
MVMKQVLRIRICIRIDLHDFGLLDLHPEPANQKLKNSEI